MRTAASWLMKRIHGPVYAARIRELVRQISKHLQAGDHVLDVGCGSGGLGEAILKAPSCPDRVQITGLERVPRGNEPVEVVAYDGKQIPFSDGSFELVLLADVLHHEADPSRLVRECARVSRRHLIIKDHKLEGPWAKQRVAFLDWAANAPYEVDCLYRYNTAAQWALFLDQPGLRIERELHSMHLYPPGFNLIFGRRLQYMAILDVRG